MKRWINVVVALVVLAVFSFGCGYVPKETKVKCPKCGAVFTIDEGLKGIKE